MFEIKIPKEENVNFFIFFSYIVWVYFPPSIFTFLLKNTVLLILMLLYIGMQMKSEIVVVGKVWITHSSSYAFVNMVPERQLILDTSPIALMKAIKNEVEIEGQLVFFIKVRVFIIFVGLIFRYIYFSVPFLGLINAHIKDAAALCSYFAWLEKELVKNKPDLTEISAEEQLEKFRKYVSC